jgi:hypothetical protein
MNAPVIDASGMHKSKQNIMKFIEVILHFNKKVSKEKM